MFITRVNLLKENKSSVLMYPEAGYSFDGTKTVLPDSLGKMVKMMKVWTQCNFKLHIGIFCIILFGLYA